MDCNIKIGAQIRLKLTFKHSEIIIDDWSIDSAIDQIFKIINSNISSYIYDEPLTLLKATVIPTYYPFFEKCNERFPIGYEHRELYYQPIAPYKMSLGMECTGILDFFPGYKDLCVDRVSLTDSDYQHIQKHINEINNSKKVINRIEENTKSDKEKFRLKIMSDIVFYENMHGSNELVLELKEVLNNRNF